MTVHCPYGIKEFYMGIQFWVKRALFVITLSFLVIFIAQYIKSNNLSYAFVQAALWGIFTSVVYLLVLWNKLRKNSSCAIKHQQEK